MKQYQFKIQWLIPVFEEGKITINNTKNLIYALGARSLTVINFLDENYKRIENYNGFISFSYDLANKITLKHIKKTLKNNPKIEFIEFLRK